MTLKPPNVTASTGRQGDWHERLCELGRSTPGEQALHPLEEPLGEVERHRGARAIRRVAQRRVQREQVGEVVDVVVGHEHGVEPQGVLDGGEVGERAVPAVEEHSSAARLEVVARARLPGTRVTCRAA